MFPRLAALIATLDEEQLEELQFVIDFALLDMARSEPTRAILETDLRYPDRPPINIAVNPHGAAIHGCAELLELIAARLKQLRK